MISMALVPVASSASISLWMSWGIPLRRLPSYPFVRVMTSARFDPATTSVCAHVLEMPPSIQKRWPSKVGPITPGRDELAAAA